VAQAARKHLGDATTFAVTYGDGLTVEAELADRVDGIHGLPLSDLIKPALAIRVRRATTM
jgi:hypothetical protein